MRHAWACILMPNFDRAIENTYRSLTDRRLAATALAIRLYAADHESRLPGKVEELVPNYLPAVPIDPFAAGGKTPLRYIRADPDPRVYSVGHNGVDNGGSDTPLNIRKDNGRWDRLDAVVHLRPRVRNTSNIPEEFKD